MPKDQLAKISFLVCGGESGPGHRPCKIEWIESIVEQCRAAGVPCWCKQDSGPRPGQQGRIPDELWRVKQIPT
jgi:protein gp37